jgi:hypothetical protein
MHLVLLVLFTKYLAPGTPDLLQVQPMPMVLATTQGKAIDTSYYYRLVGKAQARTNYKGNKRLNKLVFVSGLIGLAGIIPATITQLNRTIQEKNLNYPDQALWENRAYQEAYLKEARKIRRHQTWKALAEALWILMLVVGAGLMVWAIIKNPAEAFADLLQAIFSSLQS